MSARTPGPWFVTSQDDYPTGEVSADPMGVRHVVTTYGDEAKANARFIAAAPDMLAALQKVWEEGVIPDGYALLQDQVCDAIARATGEGA